MDDMLRTDEVAKKMQCSEETVRILIRNGTLTAYKLGRTYRVPASAIEKDLKCFGPPRTPKDKKVQ